MPAGTVDAGGGADVQRVVRGRRVTTARRRNTWGTTTSTPPAVAAPDADGARRQAPLVTDGPFAERRELPGRYQ